MTKHSELEKLVARRNQTPFENLIEITSRLPWWVGVVFTIAAYLWLHGIAVSEVTAVAQSGRMGDFVGQNLFKTLASIGQYLLPFAFLLGAAMSAYADTRRGTKN
jgi:restriction system protein